MCESVSHNILVRQQCITMSWSFLASCVNCNVLLLSHLRCTLPFMWVSLRLAPIIIVMYVYVRVYLYKSIIVIISSYRYYLLYAAICLRSIGVCIQTDSSDGYSMHCFWPGMISWLLSYPVGHIVCVLIMTQYNIINIYCM